MTYFLIDFENVHAAGIANPAVCVEGDIVCIYYGPASQNLPLETIHAFFQRDVGLQTVPVNTGSKNALDFQLTTHLGYLIGKGEHSGAAYRIVSNDTGFDCVVTYWKDKGIDIARIIDLAGSEKNVSQPKQKSQTRQKRGEKKKAETEPKAKSEPKQKVEVEPQAKPEPKQKAETEPQAKPEPKQKAKPEPQAKHEPAKKAEPEPMPQAKNEPAQKAESEPQAKNEPAPKAEPVPQQKNAPAPKTTPEQKSAPKKKNAKKTSKGIISTTKAEMLQYLDPDEYEDGLLDIFNGYKSRTTINNYFAKHFRDSQKASVIYKKLKPLMAAKEKS
jgi:hypothetical protein